MAALTALTIPESSSCPFCDYLQGTEEAVFVSRGKIASVLLNPRQYERGALLVIPNQHVSTLIDAPDHPFVAVQLEARRMARLLVEQLGATGVNVFQNAGVAAGQTVPHYHVHVVPRYPSSDPAKRFREADYNVTPIDQLRSMADVLNEPRAAFLAKLSTPVDREYERNPRLWLFLFVGWMAVALGSLARLITASEIAFGWSSTVPLCFQLLGLTVYMRAQSAKTRRGLIAGYAASIVLFIVSVLLTV